MNGLPYYQAYPRDFIEGTVGMDFETKAAYRLVLDLIYMQGGKLPDDARYISGLLGCTMRRWSALRDTLVSLNKIEIRGEFIGNYRADKELETLGKHQDKQRKNRSNTNKNKDLKSPWFNHTEPEPEATLSSVAKAPLENDLDILQSKLIEAAGEKGIQPHGAIVVGPIVELIAAGVSLEIDILPVIRSRCARLSHPVRSWSYFVQGIRDAYERRLSAGKQLPAPVPFDDSEERWARRLRAARHDKIWDTVKLGPMPGVPGCRVPEVLLIVGDGSGWKDLANTGMAA